MRNILLSTAAVVLLSTNSLLAAEVGAEIGLDFTQNDNDKIVAETSIDLNVVNPMGFGSIGVVTDGENLSLDSYSIGTSVGNATLSFGDQGDLLGSFGGKTEAVGGTTLANPNDDGESLQANFYGANLMVGFTDITSDITDVKNVQATYTVGTSLLEVQSGVDYNLDSEEVTLLSGLNIPLSNLGIDYAPVGVGLTTTYQVNAESFGFEADASAYGVTVFLNGDEDDMMQNVGAGYYGMINDMGVYAEASYNVDTEEFTPALGLGFSF